MRRPRFIARQSAKPSGPIGALIGRIMRSETTADNAMAIAELQVQPGNDVLELGCGHGRTLRQLVRLATPGAVAGLDHSRVMLDLAAAENAAAVAEGCLQLHLGDCEKLPFEPGSFDRVLCVHTAYFWNDPEVCLREIARVLRPGGRLALAHRPDDDEKARAAFPGSVYHFRSDEQILALLARAGMPGARASRLQGTGHSLQVVVAEAACTD